MSEAGLELVGVLESALTHIDGVTGKPALDLIGRQLVLNSLVVGGVDGVLDHAITTALLQYREDLRKLLPRITDDDREWIKHWAKLYNGKLTAELEASRLARELPRVPTPAPAAPEPVPSPPSQPRTYARVDDAVRAALRESHVGQLPTLINMLRSGTPHGWHDERPSHLKAYVLACLSELAYGHWTEAEELGRKGKIKVLEPSLLNCFVRQRQLSISLEEVLGFLEFPVRVRVIGDYVYVTLDLGDMVFVAVRGTRPLSIGDWVINFDARRLPWGYDSFHRGFGLQAVHAIPALQSIIGDRPAQFTGHSQGAAIAGILSMLWPGAPPHKPYLFACPRFADARAARQMTRYHFVQAFDVVPHVPPRFLGFSDDGAEITVLPDAHEASPYRDQVAEAQRNGAWRCFNHFSTHEHSMEGYRHKLGLLTDNPSAATAIIDALRAKLLQVKPPLGS